MGEDYTVTLDVTLKDYQPPEEYVDTMPPSVEMVGYTVRGGVAQSKKLVLNLYDDNKHYLNPSLPDLSGGGYENSYRQYIIYEENGLVVTLQI